MGENSDRVCHLDTLGKEIKGPPLVYKPSRVQLDFLKSEHVVRKEQP